MRAIFISVLFLTIIQTVFAQESKINPNFYFSWGYNKEWYSKSDIYVSQPALGNDYVMKGVSGNDRIGWDKVFQRDITVPQYNYRLGWFFKRKPDLGFELNFDHTKYQVTYGQSAHQVGMYEGNYVDRYFIVGDTTFYWKLNNGANFFLFNIMKRYQNFSYFNGNLVFQTILKAGVGPVIPHVENRLFGISNVPHFQLGGFNTGIEAAFRLVFFKHAYLEFAQKGDYARYFGLRLHQGIGKQSFFCYELIGNFGLTFNLKPKIKITKEIAE